MPRYNRRKKNQQRTNNKNNKQNQAQQKAAAGKSNENSTITKVTGTEPEETQPSPDDRTQQQVSRNVEESIAISESTDDRSFQKDSDTSETDLADAITTGSSNSIVASLQEDAVLPSPEEEENDTIVGHASSITRSRSSSESDTTLKDEARAVSSSSPETEISNNQNKICDITTNNAAGNLLICDNASETTQCVRQRINADDDAESSECSDSVAPIRLPIVQEVITTLYSYRVDSPKPMRPKKTGPLTKSKSLDDDDIMIQEMSDTSSTGDLTDNPPLISEASESEADMELTEQCEKYDPRILSIQTLPLDESSVEMVARTIASDSIYGESEQESQDAKMRRARKRVALETHFLPQFLNPRYLDSIKEENSDASDSMDNRSPTMEPSSFTDLEDDVFLDGGETRKSADKANAVFPKSNLDFSHKKKHISNLRPPAASVIREESPCLVVETRIIEPPEAIEEGCTGWKTATVAEASVAAEVVYIDSASSSSSDLMELDYTDGTMSATSTDYSNEDDVHIETPTIETDEAKSIFGSADTTPTRELEATNSEEYDRRQPVVNCANRSPNSSNNFSESFSAQDNCLASELRSSSERLSSCIANGQGAVPVESGSNSEPATHKPEFQIGGPCSNNMFATLLSPLINNEASPDFGKVIPGESSNRSEFVRQDSAGSHCSAQSQNTVINRGSHPSQSDLADFDTGHCVSGSSNEFGDSESSATTAIYSLRQICLEALASMPYGKVVLEELASVSDSLNELTQRHQDARIKSNDEMPYPHPDVPRIHDLVVPIATESPSQVKLMTSFPSKLQSPPPPPIPAPPKIESWLGIPTEEDPNVLVCLSPSQRDYMNNGARKSGPDTTPDSLLDMHRKFIERRGYHELSSQQVNRINREKLDQAVSSTQLRKSTTPPPPIPPPPLEHVLAANDTITNPPQSDDHGDDDVDDQNNHRLLAIIRDSKQSSTSSGNQTNQQKTEQAANSPPQSVFETIHQRTKSDQQQQTQTPEIPPRSADHLPASSTPASNPSDTSSTMASSQHNWDPFDFGNTDPRKRFSNIETASNPSSAFCSQLSQTRPKRYSNIETSSFTSKKRIENGNVIYDICDSDKQKFTAGANKSDAQVKCGDDRDRGSTIKSDIESENSTATAPKQSAQPFEKTFSQNFENRNAAQSNNNFAYDEFRQRAKESAQRAKSEFFDRQNYLLKDFDELTNMIKDDFYASESETKSKKLSTHHGGQREFKIPIQIENKDRNEEVHPRVRTIPIQVEEGLRQPAPPHSAPNSYSSSSNMQYQRERKLSEKRLSSSNLDEWMSCINDLGASSENITKPIQKEVEICIGRRSNIRAPRLSASTSNLSSIGTHEDHIHDRRHYSTSQSTIDTTPISPCLSHHPRRKSLPKEYHDKQLEYIRSKESELQAEFDKLESDRRRLIDEIQASHQLQKDAFHYRSCRLPTLSEEEAFRQQMHDEWLNKVAEREERRLHKIIKISGPSDDLAPQVPDRNAAKTDIGDEFLKRVKERRSKLCMPSDSDWESGAESHPVLKPNNNGSDTSPPPIKVIEGESERDFKNLPKHLREFADITNKILKQHEKEEVQESSFKSTTTSSSLIKKDGVWTPVYKTGTTIETSKTEHKSSSTQVPPTPPPPPIWSPQASPVPGRKEFRPVKFESPVLTRKYTAPKQQDTAPATPPWSYSDSKPLYNTQSTSCSNINNNNSSSNYSGFQCPQYRPQNLRKSESVGTFTAQQPSGASYTETNRPQIPKDQNRGFVRPNEVVFQLKNEYMSEPEGEYDRPKKMAQLARRKFEGIGPTTKDGMPIVLRSEVKENNQHKWYKRMYNTLHKTKDDDEYVTIRYKTHRGRYPYKSNGYMSEPEPNYDSDYSTMKYHTLDRRRIPSTGSYQDERSYGTMPNPVRPSPGSYKIQPGRIENYTPSRSSVSDKEKKEHLEQQKLSTNYTEGYLSRALKEQGYDSDSNLVLRKKDESQFAPLSPVEQRQAYRSVQSGGEPPLQGFRKSAPEKPKESPRRYIEGDVNIHYKSPIRYEYKDVIPEEELARNQAESMKKLYQEERRRKYLQELQDMSNRRHTDNFTPSQKSPISLNRYDDFPTDVSPKSPGSNNLPRTIARALYNFQGQTARELTFKKGDIIYIRRQIDKNWYEGEHNAMVGLLPANYVELITKDGARPPPPKKPSEGQARAKFNFSAQTGMELSLNKGELVTLTRRVDANWFEGKIANRKGIFPVSYVDVLTDIGVNDCLQASSGRTSVLSKPIGAPASHSLVTTNNPSPTLDQLRTSLNNEFNNLTNGHPPNGILRETKSVHKTEVLHVDTNSEPLAYRALYKYRPQNNDELELQEGDIVFVLEICDDGWYVGTSQRTGHFGTFPGNYVERV